MFAVSLRAFCIGNTLVSGSADSKSSLGCLLMDAGSELVIIHHGLFIRRWLEAVYSTELYIPWSTVQSVELAQWPNGRKSSIPALKIAVRGHAINVELFAPSDKHEQLVAAMKARISR